MSYLCNRCGSEHAPNAARDIAQTCPAEERCWICEVNIRDNGGVRYIVSDAWLLEFETRQALRDGFLLGEKEAVAVWSELHGKSMPERLKLADLIAKKYGLP